MQENRITHYDLQVTIDELHPFSRYTISVKASPKKEYRRMGMDDVESSEIEVKGSQKDKHGDYSLPR